MSETNTDDTEQLTCPVCGDPLLMDEDWMVTDRSLIGTEIKAGESLQGDYAHGRCLDTGMERDDRSATEGNSDDDLVTDGGRDVSTSDDTEWCGSCFSELGTEESCMSCQMRREGYI